MAVLVHVVRSGSPIANATVAMSILGPDGKAVALQAVTDGQGYALAQYQISRTGRVGAYGLTLVDVIGSGAPLNPQGSVTQANFTVN